MANLIQLCIQVRIEQLERSCSDLKGPLAKIAKIGQLQTKDRKIYTQLWLDFLSDTSLAHFRLFAFHAAVNIKSPKN